MSILDVLHDIGAAAHEIIDSYFIQSDLVDLNLTEAECCQTAYFDALASHTANSGNTDSDIPIGKQVL